ncbi:hypothetical protein OCF84_20665 (plasmid) [Shewanella xiamenensis]|uniref:Uncharacterized protein n=1 Tax=Shewanella xiamenensis TaxID=332186 RepID=A0ABT6UFS2_9GAMM|nr:hypothetical protein [Shewanella xiamenensis]MDI5833317.1 hypothetical protein [Shewanella xiamenensis]WHF57931.1 hypothetical protein OCF84_20665 [Shewanella xiamenensis]
MSSLEQVRRAAITASYKNEVGINEKSIQIVTSLIVTAITSQQFSSQQDLAYLMKTLLDESQKLKVLMDNSAPSKSNDVNAVILVCDLFAKTGITSLEEVGKYFSCFNIIKSNEFSEIAPEAVKSLNDLIKEADAYSANEQFLIDSKILEVLARLIPYFISSLDEYVNIKTQIINSLETMTSGINIVINSTGGVEKGREWVLTCIDSTVELYINTLKQVLSFSENRVLNVILLADVKKAFAVNIGNLILSLKYISPLIVGEKKQND